MNFNEKVVIGSKNPVTAFSIFLAEIRGIGLKRRDEKLINVRDFATERCTKTKLNFCCDAKHNTYSSTKMQRFPYLKFLI